ncbi:hypothetical protein NGM10_16450 (plasmid) [Halorussus salilacus]|uniref:DUF7504 family protein n=1 Tax=Halorussus salilacus TaxID=2953750 RepID=UPI00209F95E7|nr:hypothetical protein [Halorussus salilacus]USZ69993.1 hypothetical protein NGM10_16450 [Halorussus salilacus]
MSTDQPHPSRADDGPPDDLSAFIGLLNELKTTGCNLLVVGDAPREVFTRASGRLLGDDDQLRYRLLAVTDATPRSIAERLPDPDAAPRSLTETTRILNHTGAPRSVTAATDPTTPPELAGIRETCVADPELRGLQSALAEAIDETENRADRLRPADLRVCLDSLGPLIDHYGPDVVRRCIDAVGGHVRDRDAMAHYVLANAYDSDPVQALAPGVDAIIELRTVDPDEYGHDAQQRWHVPRRDITTEWTPL